MTFLTDPQDFKTFFHSPNVDFQRAVKSAVERTGTVTGQKSALKMTRTIKLKTAPERSCFCTLMCVIHSTGAIKADVFWKYHKELHDATKSHLAPGLLTPFCHSLCFKFKHELQQWIEQGFHLTVPKKFFDNLRAESKYGFLCLVFRRGRSEQHGSKHDVQSGT